MARAHSGREESTKRAQGMQIRFKSQKETKYRRVKVAMPFINRQGKERYLSDSPMIKKENLR
jgi:hypothetical protein